MRVATRGTALYSRANPVQTCKVRHLSSVTGLARHLEFFGKTRRQPHARRSVECAAEPSWVLEAAVSQDRLVARAAGVALTGCIAWFFVDLVQTQLRRERDPRLRLWDESRMFNSWNSEEYWEHCTLATIAQEEWDVAYDVNHDQVAGGFLLVAAENTSRHWRALVLGEIVKSMRLHDKLSPHLALSLLQWGSNVALNAPSGRWQLPIADLLVSPEVMECVYAGWLLEMLTRGPRWAIQTSRAIVKSVEDMAQGFEDAGEPL